jgi:tripartite ATP-independent transporter DctP family solute receptor
MAKRLLCVAGLVLTVLIGGCSGKEQPPAGGEGKRVYKLASLTSVDHTYNQGAARFAELVKERSKGRIEIVIYPDGQLAKGERELLEAVQQGSIDFYVGSTGPVGGFSPSMGILDLPFLFRDYAHVDKILDGPIGRRLLDDLEKANLKGLAFWENGFRNLTNSKRVVKAPEDARGLKIRTMENKLHLAAWKAVGADPVPMAYGEVYGALQKKTIDGQENPVAVIYTAKFNEVQKYLSLTQHVYSPALVVVSPKTWQTLGPEDRDMLLATAREVAPYQRKLGRDNEERQIAALAAQGMTVTRDINKAAWYRVMEGAMGDFIRTLGKENVAAIIDMK